LFDEGRANQSSGMSLTLKKNSLPTELEENDERSPSWSGQYDQTFSQPICKGTKKEEADEEVELPKPAQTMENPTTSIVGAIENQ
jgi:hypothetical protein